MDSATTQPEAVLEDKFIDQLETLGYEKVAVRNEDDLTQNLKSQLEKHNNITLSDREFDQVLAELSRGDIFDKAVRLRDRINYKDDDGDTRSIELVNRLKWCKNEFQVTHQVTMEGSYGNRYDVTILINGLPLVQIELKRRGLEIKEAFNQTKRYHKHSYWVGWKLFGYIQVFVISNGVNTKYYANNPVGMLDFKQTFFWADRDNRRFSQLSEFAEVFLEKCQLSKLITKYVVMSETDRMLMVLRPYQYHAVEAIVERVRTSGRFGYIWHTTGSGKTLTAFKTAQILTGTSNVHKVLFVVDRKDLDYKTITDFNNFKKGSVDATNNTRELVRQLGDEDINLVVTTLQKLNNATLKRHHSQVMDGLRDKRMVFIFDECHRSQFGVTHKNILKFFPKAQMFGFTGTPIFAQNATFGEHGKRTTADLFEECLHKYVITDAINDENVLRFSIEYYRTFTEREDKDDEDIKVEAINTQEVWEAEERLNDVTDHIIANHARKTHNREFNAIFCVSNIKTLIRYYDLFKQKKESGEHDLKIATIFSYQVNEDDSDPSGSLDTDFIETSTDPVDEHNRDSLDRFIQDYNGTYGTNYSTKDSFYQYYQDIGKRVRERAKNKMTGKDIDILLVVNMFLTGFDCALLNTIYVDKNLKYHGLIQAYSRTNRILGSKKSHGNVLCYRNLKPATDQAVALFADKDALEKIALEPYGKYVEYFNDAVAKLREIADTVDSVDNLVREDDQAGFIKAFRRLIRLMNVLVCFTEFDFDKLDMDAQTFEDYKSKYLDLHDKIKTDRQKEEVSILDDIDFEMELIRRDNINVSYILDLLVAMKKATQGEREKRLRLIMRTLDTEVQLRSKRELIKQFIEQELPAISQGGDVRGAFYRYFEEQKEQAIESLCEDEGLDTQGLRRLIDNYKFNERMPVRRDVINIMHKRPMLRERIEVGNYIISKFRELVETFVDGID